MWLSSYQRGMKLDKLSHTHAHTRAHTYAGTHAQTHTDTRTTHTRIHTHAHANVQAHTRAWFKPTWMYWSASGQSCRGHRQRRASPGWCWRRRPRSRAGGLLRWRWGRAWPSWTAQSRTSMQKMNEVSSRSVQKVLPSNPLILHDGKPAHQRPVYQLIHCKIYTFVYQNEWELKDQI